jgi:hypothetical protein
MNANELRIGNYYDHNGEIKTVTPNTILEVWEAKRNWCKAISLTEEWLLKFGFEKIIFGFSTFYDLYFNPRFVLRFYMIPNELDLIQDDRKLSFKASHVLYVHQLQNLYFALTGEELIVSNIVNENLQQNTVSCLNCPTCNGDSWMQNLIQSEKKYCKCGAIF